MEDARLIEVTDTPLEYTVKHIPLKRIFDVIFSACVLIIFSPLFALIALVIFATSGNKVIFSHQRIGRGGLPFRCYKFRTMRKDADKLLKALLEQNPELKHEWEQFRKLKNDPRITFIGKFLRKTSLDELPQFYNVLRGDLSIVGPRPVVKSELDRYYQFKAAKILSIRPGLTGLWQVSGRSDTGYAKRVELDEAYIDTRTLLLDVEIILRTIPVMIRSKGAY